jgi:hypothetical protein
MYPDAFSHLLVNETLTSQWKYVRDVSPDWTITPVPVGPESLKRAPQYPPDIFNNNIRCGRDAWMVKPNGTGRLTETADIVAGSNIGFRVGVQVVS